MIAGEVGGRRVTYDEAGALESLLIRAFCEMQDTCLGFQVPSAYLLVPEPHFILHDTNPSVTTSTSTPVSIT